MPRYSHQLHHHLSTCSRCRFHRCPSSLFTTGLVTSSTSCVASPPSIVLSEAQTPLIAPHVASAPSTTPHVASSPSITPRVASLPSHAPHAPSTVPCVARHLRSRYVLPCCPRTRHTWPSRREMHHTRSRTFRRLQLVLSISPTSTSNVCGLVLRFALLTSRPVPLPTPMTSCRCTIWLPSIVTPAMSTRSSRINWPVLSD
jgi:hypothetical protein